MDKITKKWQNFLLEGKSFPYQIYCDMDGVLVDLLGGIEQELGFRDMDENIRSAAMQALKSGEVWSDLIKKDKEYPELSLGTREIFKIISNDNNIWANLPPMKHAQKLWGFLSSLNPTPYILSAPWDRESEQGKILWLSGLAANLDPPPPKDRIILTHNKHEYAISWEEDEHGEPVAKPNILIDDMDKYIGPWRQKLEEHGLSPEFAIQHTSVKNTIRELEKWL